MSSESVSEGQITVTPTREQGCNGRPAFVIPLEALEFFLDNSFKVQDIADMFGVSKRTIERRLQEHNLSIRNTYSMITDMELVEKITTIVQNFPNIGYRTVYSMLLAQGHRVQEYRIRNALEMLTLKEFYLDDYS